MTPRDEVVFAQGMLFGIALFAHELQKVFAGLDERVARVERELKPPPPPPWPRRLPRLVPAGWRDGQRLFRMAGRYG